MKICWDNLENLRLNKNGNQLKNHKTGLKYKIIDSCLICGEEFLSSSRNPKTCSRECSNEYVSRNKRSNKDYIVEYLNNEGYTLLSDYISNKKKIKVRCPNNHESWIIFGNFKAGRRCKKCEWDKRKHSYKYIKEYIENEGYQLLSTTYKSIDGKLHLVCPEGHDYYTTFHMFQSGRRCYECFGNKPYSNEYVKKFIEQKGFELLSEYKNYHEEMKMKCPEGHIFLRNFKMFKDNGHGCPYCAKNRKKTYEEIEEILSEENYKLLTTKEEYKNIQQVVSILCPKGHVYKHRISYFLNGFKCPQCFHNVSVPEKEVRDFVKSMNLNTEIFFNDRTQITNPLTNRKLELDVWIPELNKSIEFNGDYYHSLPGVKERDLIKKDQCNENEIDLLIITETQWKNDRCGMESKIKNFLKEKLYD